MKSFAQWFLEQARQPLLDEAFESTEIGETVEEQDLGNELGELMLSLLDCVQTASFLVSKLMHDKKIVSLSAEQAALYESQLEKGLMQIEAKLSSSLAAALLPLFEDEIVRRAINDLAEVLQPSLKVLGQSVLSIQSPAHLQSRLVEGLARRGLAVDVEPSATTTEIVARVENLTIEARCSDWTSKLREAAQQ